MLRLLKDSARVLMVISRVQFRATIGMDGRLDFQLVGILEVFDGGLRRHVLTGGHGLSYLSEDIQVRVRNNDAELGDHLVEAWAAFWYVWSD